MTLDLATRALVSQMENSCRVPTHLLEPEEARAAAGAVKSLFGPGPEVDRVVETSVDVDGATIPVRVLVPHASTSGTIVYFHGGGWVVGDIDGVDNLARRLAKATGLAVALVAYRKAPEWPFPTAVDDAWAATKWVAAHCDQWARDDHHLVVAGESAGANLATVTALHASHGNELKIDLQVLVYPVTDTEDETDSYRDPENQLLLSAETMRWFLDHYDPGAANRDDPRLAPLKAKDLSGVANAVVVTAEHDVLRSEGASYVARLRDAGVNVVYQEFPGQMHGFFTMLDLLPASAQALDFVSKHIVQHVEKGARG